MKIAHRLSFYYILYHIECFCFREMFFKISKEKKLNLPSFEMYYYMQAVYLPKILVITSTDAGITLYSTYCILK